MSTLNQFGTGNISKIISYLKIKYSTTDITDIPTKEKLYALCEVVQLSFKEFDQLIAYNSPVLRTVKGHAFEVVFDYIIRENGYKVTEIGGDGGVDRIINGVTLQLKTPHAKGTKGYIAEYKTHKTHGAKSEKEGPDYYHSVNEFAEYFVGLISYNPFKIIFIDKNSLPKHPLYIDRINSPFQVNWDNNSGINNFGLVDINSISLDASSFAASNLHMELLPLSAKVTGLKTDVIVDTILKENNFRVWDMCMRGFAREFAFRRLLYSSNVTPHAAKTGRQHRTDKADFTLLSKQGNYSFFQMKGLSVGLCCFDGKKSKVAVESQLTRGRRNDHPTQSRLYLVADFDYLIIAIDPPIVQILQSENGNSIPLGWEFYAIPSHELLKYSKIIHRYDPIQKFLYPDLQRFLITDQWLNNWQ